MKQLLVNSLHGHNAKQTIACMPLILFLLALFSVSPAFASDSSALVGEFGAQVVPAKANALSSSGCVCDCVYTKTDKIKNHRFFESSPSLSCEAIQGQACLGAHRGQSFRGKIRDCSAGPRDSTDLDTATWMNIAGYQAKRAKNLYN